jgi:hypothetical protein
MFHEQNFTTGELILRFIDTNYKCIDNNHWKAEKHELHMSPPWIFDDERPFVIYYNITS